MPRRGVRAGIPAPIGVQDPAVEKILWAMRERLQEESGTGTARDPGKAGGGTGEGGAGEPGTVRPLAPQGLVATGIFGAVILEVDRVPQGAAYIEWLAYDADDVGQAQVVGTSQVPIWQHGVGDSTGRYYWARGVGYGSPGLVGPLNQTAGTYAESAADVDYLKSQLEGAIGKDQLAEDLASPIATLENTVTYTVQASGNASFDLAPGFFDKDGGLIYTGSRSWNVVVIDSASGDMSKTTYDLFGNSGVNGPLMSADLDALGRDKVVVIYTEDEPSRGKGIIKDALARCGATRRTIDRIVYRGAYILVGIPGIGEGNGIEQYAGDFNSDPDASVEYHLQLYKGRPLGLVGNTAIAPISVNVDELNGQYTVKIDNNGHVAGYGLANTPVDGTPLSRFYIRADRVAVIDPADSGEGSARYPWIVDNGVVYSDTAMIKNATITSAKIQSVAANKVVASSLSAITANLGTVNAGTFRTSGGSAWRAEMSSGGAYPFWFGSGSKSAGNARFYLDTSGNVFARGNIEATSIKANSANIISSLMLQDQAVTFPLGDSVTTAKALSEGSWGTLNTIYTPGDWPGGVTMRLDMFIVADLYASSDQSGTGTLQAWVRYLVDGQAYSSTLITDKEMDKTVLVYEGDGQYRYRYGVYEYFGPMSFRFPVSVPSGSHTIQLQMRFVTTETYSRHLVASHRIATLTALKK